MYTHSTRVTQTTPPFFLFSFFFSFLLLLRLFPLHLFFSAFTALLFSSCFSFLLFLSSSLFHLFSLPSLYPLFFPTSIPTSSFHSSLSPRFLFLSIAALLHPPPLGTKVRQNIILRTQPKPTQAAAAVHSQPLVERCCDPRTPNDALCAARPFLVSCPPNFPLIFRWRLRRLEDNISHYPHVDKSLTLGLLQASSWRSVLLIPVARLGKSICRRLSERGSK